MPRKKSGKKAAQEFVTTLDRIQSFVDEIELVTPKPSAQAVTWVYEVALVKTAVAFEKLMLDCLVTAINNDTTTISQRTGTQFPKHLTDEVCQYLVTGGGYFDFRGRDGLLKVIRQYVPMSHWLFVIVRKAVYKQPLERLIALRNLAAHESPQAKASALEAVSVARMASAGSWLKRQRRYAALSRSLRSLAAEVEAAARY